MFDEQPDGDTHGECAAEIHRLQAELAACAAALPGPLYMDPPGGGSVTVGEQIERMAKDAARYRWLLQNSGFSIAENIFGAQSMRDFRDEHLDSLIDAQMEPSSCVEDMRAEERRAEFDAEMRTDAFGDRF